MDYQEFLQSKITKATQVGFDISPNSLPDTLFPWQRHVTAWGLRHGRCAFFTSTGTGKTRMSVTWADEVSKYLSGRVLMIAPLFVAHQTIKEASEKLGKTIQYASRQSEVREDSPALIITNWEMMTNFDMSQFVGVVIDESSRLKSEGSKHREQVTEMCVNVPMRLCCTATPAPNDVAELANHAEFLGIMTRTEMLAMFFVHDENGWRLKGHAKDAFYRWLASWAMSVRIPSDIGFDDNGYILPPLTITPVWVESEWKPEGTLVAGALGGNTERVKARKATASDRVTITADIVNNSTEQWVCWCGLNDESTQLAKAIPGSIEISGATKADDKWRLIDEWFSGKHRVLISKGKILGWGSNFQNCHKTAFCGLNDSWEMFYQIIKRFHRYGQVNPVEAVVVMSTAEQTVYQNVMNKEKEANLMTDQLIEAVRNFERDELKGVRQEFVYVTGESSGENWRMLLGDSVDRLKEFASNSIHFSVKSPPFMSLFTYTPSEHDMGNCTTDEEFFAHYRYIIEEEFRVTMPGRISAVHVADVPAMLVRDGYIGLKDFSGRVIRAYQDAGWIWDARIPIDKNQQMQSIRTHSKALTMTQMRKDRSWLRPALPDYILKFRKPGDNPIPVCDGMSGDEWIELANPTWPGDSDRCLDSGAMATWYGISESDTLQGWRNARASQDERHICVLQIATIERCIKLWTNPGETVLSPFAGIASEIHTAVRLGRNGIGIELKPEYYAQAVINMQRLMNEMTQQSLFDLDAS